MKWKSIIKSLWYVVFKYTLCDCLSLETHRSNYRGKKHCGLRNFFANDLLQRLQTIIGHKVKIWLSCGLQALSLLRNMSDFGCCNDFKVSRETQKRKKITEATLPTYGKVTIGLSVSSLIIPLLQEHNNKTVRGCLHIFYF